METMWSVGPATQVTFDVRQPMSDLPTIRGKCDLETAERLVALGYPAVAPALPELLEWIQDINWPVAHILAPFLATVGRPLVPELWRVLHSDDSMWKYWCISYIIAEMPLDVAVEFEPELSRLAHDPAPWERAEELDDVARDALARLAKRRAV